MPTYPRAASYRSKPCWRKGARKCDSAEKIRASPHFHRSGPASNRAINRRARQQQQEQSIASACLARLAIISALPGRGGPGGGGGGRGGGRGARPAGGRPPF